MNRKKLLSIGELAKYTGVGIKALRYYDRINILKPVYVDPDSARRYYSFNQIYLVGLITFCVELDIPLKELTEFISGHKVMDFQGFLSQGREAAMSKMKSVEKGLKYIKSLEQSMNNYTEQPLEHIYSREYPEKIFEVKPYKQSFHKATERELVKLLFELPYDKGDINNYELLENGFLLKYSPLNTERYAFMEVQHRRATEGCIVIPGGLYACRYDDKRQIEQAADIFMDYLAGGKSFFAIETEIFFSKMDTNKSIYELRVIAW